MLGEAVRCPPVCCYVYEGANVCRTTNTTVEGTRTAGTKEAAAAAGTIEIDDTAADDYAQ
jgi:hypothetical protein